MVVEDEKLRGKEILPRLGQAKYRITFSIQKAKQKCVFSWTPAKVSF